MTTVSVVIRCLNEEAHIGRLLSGLERQGRRADQIIVVDSGSSDSTVDIARRYGAEIVEIKPSEFSFGRALNRGCEAASGDVLVFLSAHVYPVYDSFLELMVEPFASPEVALSYGRQVGDHRTRFSEARVMAQWFPSKSVHRQNHPFCNNANAAVRRSVWQDLPYDEELTGLEDLDWARRAMDAGHSLSYVAEAPIVHVHEETWSTILNRYRREAIAYQRILPDDPHLKGVESLKLALSNVVGDYRQAANEKVLVPNLTGIATFRIAQFLGTWQGFRQDDSVSENLKRRFYYPAARSSVAAPGLSGLPGRMIDYSDHELEQQGR